MNEMNYNRQNMGLPFGYDPPRTFEGVELLSTMMRQQYEMQRDVYGIDYKALTDAERVSHFKEMYIALDDEMHEALGEMGWKPWASSKHFNKAAVQGELIDAWHFFMNLMMIAGMTPEDLFENYQTKRAKNIKRQEENYDGVTTKCRGCKRAFDDDAVRCHQSVQGPEVSCCHYHDPNGILVH